MKLRLLAVGRKIPGWVQSGVDQYARRLPPHLPLEIVEIAPGQRTRGASIERALEAERDAIARHINPSDRVIALDVRGKAWSTEELAGRLAGWQADGADVAMLVGGPEGLHADLAAQARERWSLGPLTLPHALVRVIVAEALYRAWTVLSGHPYHRG